MMRIVMGAMAALAVAMPAIAADWAVFRDEGLKFEVEVPMELSRRQVEPGMTGFTGGDSEGGALAVSIIVMQLQPADFIGEDIHAALDLAIATSIRTAGAVPDGAPETVMISGVTGRQGRYRLTRYGVTLTGRTVGFRKGNTVYLLMVGGEASRKEDADRVVRSFRGTGRDVRGET